jgi:hypothetical protein
MSMVNLFLEEAGCPPQHGDSTHAPGKFTAASQAKQRIPAHAKVPDARRDEIKRQFAIAGSAYRAAELLFVGGENGDALPSTGDRDIPLLSICGRPHGRIRKQDVIHRLAL